MNLRIAKPSIWGQPQTTPFVTTGYPDVLQPDPTAFNINLAEVQVYSGPPYSPATNLVTSASAMSSTHPSYPVTLCTDGITSNFCSTGGSDTEAWWLTNGIANPIATANVWPRYTSAACCAGRMGGSLISAEANQYGRGTLPFWGTKPASWAPTHPFSASMGCLAAATFATPILTPSKCSQCPCPAVAPLPPLPSSSSTPAGIVAWGGCRAPFWMCAGAATPPPGA